MWILSYKSDLHHFLANVDRSLLWNNILGPAAGFQVLHRKLTSPRCTLFITAANSGCETQVLQPCSCSLSKWFIISAESALYLNADIPHQEGAGLRLCSESGPCWRWQSCCRINHPNLQKTDAFMESSHFFDWALITIWQRINLQVNLHLTYIWPGFRLKTTGYVFLLFMSVKPSRSDQ